MLQARFHPLIAEWFDSNVGTPTEVQQQAWPAIQSRVDVLIAAPTGSGKTFAAFLSCIDRLFKQALARELDDHTQVLYVSPLKALSNDIQKNLQQPLAEIGTAALSAGLLMPELRVLVRTGDTPMTERQQMLKRPPHILVTTPESLFILLTAEKSRRLLRTIRTVIVDEIHAVAPNKRGAHLALSLERLEALTLTKPQRIGLSATQRPIETVARFLVGDRPMPTIIDVGHKREMDLAVEVPKDELSAVATNAIWSDVYERLAELVRAHRSTLVFVNTRRLAERVSHHLEERLQDLGADSVAAHHGSLSRQIRLSVEERLKSGQTRVVVATASLELGIDIGAVDLVCQIGSPRAIATCLQRVGRAGHWVNAIPKGRLFAMTRDDLLECAVLIRAIRTGVLDRIAVPPAPLDILAQQLVAAAATQTWQEDDLFDLCRRADPYRTLARSGFDQVLRMLADGIATNRGRGLAYLHHDRINHRIKGRRGARLAAITSGGAIPDTANYAVVAEPEGTVVDRLMKTLQWRVWPATSCCWATCPGGSKAWRWARCGWKTPMARHRTFLSGAAKPHPAQQSCPPKLRVFELRLIGFLLWISHPSPLTPLRYSGFARNAPWISVGRSKPSNMCWQARLCLEPSQRSKRSSRSGSSMKAAGCSWSCTRPSEAGSIGPGASP